MTTSTTSASSEQLGGGAGARNGGNFLGRLLSGIFEAFIGFGLLGAKPFRVWPPIAGGVF